MEKIIGIVTDKKVLAAERYELISMNKKLRKELHNTKYSLARSEARVAFLEKIIEIARNDIGRYGHEYSFVSLLRNLRRGFVVESRK